MDMDVEAMLEAPYQEKQKENLQVIVEKEMTAIETKEEDIPLVRLLTAHDRDRIVLTPDTAVDIVAILVIIVAALVLDPLIEIADIATIHEIVEDAVAARLDAAVEALIKTSMRRRRRRSPSPPIPEEERDRRTVFVTQLAQRLKPQEFEDFFVQAGRVRDARIIADRNSRRSKGVGYVEFYDEASVQNALAMSGQKLLGIPVLVQLSEAEKNRLAMQAERNLKLAQQEQELLYQRLYVGSIHFSLTEDDIRQIFEPFGPLEFVNLHMDPETGRSKGFAFVQFKNSNDAKQALEKMNGFELAGRNLKVGLVTEKQTAMMSYNLDDDETAGVALNSLSRTELMKKLAARQTDLMMETAVEPAVVPKAKPNIPQSATRTIMLNNMFNPAEETEPDWERDLETDVKDECMQYGEVIHIHVNTESLGEVYIKFDSTDAAMKATHALNGRWFGGRQITAGYVPEAIYNARFSL
ncbi:uncharacterized protein BYT42DRAFT_618387 [Radiomyces spectabilis]|uniref:uncharacterized protein n=1 Tax=Radiomyces spectabilis TaxID=64574 RepID=UPI0022205FF2|nr:uncharacterized protein BYT42DRAFT_618387 [Radiomyces spectabilis]KAI8365936.1 hypothetical protein BYT42DRAFT_618387 [Radiomyces spectabilis]